MTHSPAYYLDAIAVVPGAHTYRQDTLAEDLRRRLAGVAGAEKVTQVVGFIYDHSAIRQRHLELEIAAIDARDDWYRLVNDATFSLASRALARLDDVGSSLADCDALVVVSSTYAGFPGLSRRLQAAFELPVSCLCYDLAALGCAAPTHGLHLAQRLLEQDGCRAVCVVCADAMGTHGQSRRHTSAPRVEQVVAHCLASDGAAAVVLRREPRARTPIRYRRMALRSRLWPDSLDQNDLTASADNQPFISVGKEIRTRLVSELAEVIDDEAVAEPLFLHPGGAALMRALREAHPQLAATVELSSSVLADHGNIGSASVLWVLDRALAGGFAVAPRFRVFALGPGIVTTLLVVDGAERLAGDDA